MRQSTMACYQTVCCLIEQVVRVMTAWECYGLRMLSPVIPLHLACV